MSIRRRPPPGIYARNTVDTSEEFFERRVMNLEDLEYLRAIVKCEAEGKADPDRISLVNQRIEEVKGDDDPDESGGESDGGEAGEDRA